MHNCEHFPLTIRKTSMTEISDTSTFKDYSGN